MLNRTEAPRHGANTPHILIVLILALILTVGGSAGCSSAGAATGSAAQAVAGSSAIGNAHAGTGAENAAASNTSSDYQTPGTSSGFDYSQVPAYSGSPYAVINDNAPHLNAADAEALLAQASSPAEAEKFSPLDSLGRCGAAMAVVSPDTEPAGTAAQSNDEQARTYVLNTNTRKFHLPGCRSVSRMKARNKQEVTMTRSEVMTRGYEPCAQCNP